MTTCDVTACRVDYERTVLRSQRRCELIDFERVDRLRTSLGVRTPLKEHFGVSSAVRAGKL
ncbi:hypothetical protein AVEN_196485-1, partial [Araneus ventricosus]